MKSIKQADGRLAGKYYPTTSKIEKAMIASSGKCFESDPKLPDVKGSRAQPPDHGERTPLLGKMPAARRPTEDDLDQKPGIKRAKTSESRQAKVEGEAESPPPPVLPFPEQPAVLEERSGSIQVRVIKNDGLRENSIVLTRIKCLFQSQLPAMPKEYITRLVFDCAQSSLAIVKLPSLEVLGAITYREFVPRRFAEIVFCAVASDQHAKGYGAHLMAHLKDYIRSTTPIMHLLTYADNLALGYFRKQGFTRDISLDRSVWVGYVKDYKGATMMQCSMIPRIRYLEASRMLKKQKETVQAKISEGSKGNDVVHAPPKQWVNGHVTPIDPLSISAIRATGWSPEMDALAREPRFRPHVRAMRRFLYQLQAHRDAWPFLVPVNSDEVPDYYDFIKKPMDLSTVEARLNDKHYAGPEDFVADIELIFSNCRYYNRASSVYCKCAKRLETYMWKIADENPEWSGLLNH